MALGRSLFLFGEFLLVSVNGVGRLFTLGLFCFCVASAFSQNSESDKKETVVYVRAKAHAGKSARKGSVVRVDSGVASAYGSAKLSEVLEKEAGTIIRRYGPAGTASSMSIRASTPQQVNVYFDGILLNDPLGGGVNLEEFPTEMVESAVLYKDSIPSEYFGSNLAGALDLLPPAMRRQSETQYSYSIDTLNSMGVSLLLSRPGGSNTLHSFSLEGSRDRYAYLDDGGTSFFNTTDDRVRIRENEDFLQGGYAGRFTYQVGKTSNPLRGRVLLFTVAKERGLPGVVGAPTRKTRLQTSKGLLIHSLSSSWGKNWLWQWQTGLLAGQNILRDPDRELATGFSSEKRDSISSQNHLQVGWVKTSGLSLLKFSFPLQVQYSRLHRNQKWLADRAEGQGGVSGTWSPNRKLVSFLAEAKAGLQKDDSTLADLPRQEEALSGYARVGFMPVAIFRELLRSHARSSAAEKWELFFTAAFSERLPSMSERYGDGGLLLPSASLKKENSVSYSGGLQGGAPCFKLQCSLRGELFYSNRRNLIMFIANSQKTMIALNIASAEVMGYEAELKVKYHEWFFVKGSYTYTRAVDTGSLPYYKGKQLPYQPLHKLDILLDGGSPAFRIFSGVVFSGALFRDRYNSYYAYREAIWRMFSGVHYIFGNQKKYKLTFLVKNITDEKSQDVIGYPLPGRSFHLKFTGRF